MNIKSISILIPCIVLYACCPDRSLSESDLEAIATLRTDLVSAIEAGDAARYASLCTDDVKLLHPHSAMVTGRTDLQAHNAEFFELFEVLSLELTPVIVSGTGDLAYEVGTQKLEITPLTSGFQSVRKYTHVLKRNTDGVWKFAVLMSNNSKQ
jgi:uncharacterized protein (TIGR02246 family)